jgi:hypothetical protein
MKKIVVIALSVVMFSCSSNDKKTTEESKTPNEAGVQNANGNIPDTTNAINLSTHKTDTTQKDSLKK